MTCSTMVMEVRGCSAPSTTASHVFLISRSRLFSATPGKSGVGRSQALPFLHMPHPGLWKGPAVSAWVGAGPCMDDMDSEWAGGRAWLLPTPPLPPPASSKGASWGRKTPEFPCPVLLPRLTQWAQSAEVRETGVRGQKNKLMERRGGGARKERKRRLRETERQREK